MKIDIGPYTNWFGPYQLADALCFWVKKVPDEYGIMSKPEWVHKFGEWLAHGSVEPEDEVGSISNFSNKDRPNTWLYNLLLWIDSKKKRKMKIHIDRYDTWGMYNTLAVIILPMLKQLKATKHGSGYVDMEDVPEAMRATNADEHETDQYAFDFYYGDAELNKQNIQCDVHTRWDWALDEMIFAFEHIVDDTWEDEYRSGEFHLMSEKLENGMSRIIEGPNHTYTCDYEGIRKVEERINNGLRLFGKYFRNLWD